ncbi:3'-5' exoribonuclease domain-containing protein [Mycolicibacterium gilvum]|uniref:3'-5' exoribonuclease domain-containing protein n=1 Tax=Mycolicibacterium gilvum TaxID=1804 RepID=UPI0040464BA9
MSPRNYCYDTEFLEDGETINLISIGIVCDDGREYYAVNSDADWDRIENDDWLMTNVVPHLPMRPGKPPYKFEGLAWIWGLDRSSVLIKPKWLIANEVREFILESVKFGDNPRLWAYYGAYDHVALAQLFGKMIHLPDGIPMFTHELKQLMEEMPRTWVPPVHEDEHDALADARWNMKVLKAIQKAQR